MMVTALINTAQFINGSQHKVPTNVVKTVMVSCHISPQLVAPVGKKQDPNVGDSYVAESQGQKVPTDFGHLR